MEIRTADWKTEKHVPVISIERGEKLKVTVSVGDQVPHPNTFEHHIKWVELYLNDVLIGRADFSAHGESGVFAEPVAHFEFPAVGGKLTALALCNIHGLWKSEEVI